MAQTTPWHRKLFHARHEQQTSALVAVVSIVLSVYECNWDRARSCIRTTSRGSTCRRTSQALKHLSIVPPVAPRLTPALRALPTKRQTHPANAWKYVGKCHKVVQSARQCLIVYINNNRTIEQPSKQYEHNRCEHWFLERRNTIVAWKYLLQTCW
jgi:hypothetical protein